MVHGELGGLDGTYAFAGCGPAGTLCAMSFDLIVRAPKEPVTTKDWREALAAVGVRCRFPARFSLESWDGGALPLRVSAKAGEWFRERVVDEEISVDVDASDDVSFSSSGDSVELALQCALAGTLAARSKGTLVDTWSGESAEGAGALELARKSVARERARLGEVAPEVPFAKRVFDRLAPALPDFRVTGRRASGIGFVRVRDGVRIVVNFRRHHEDSVLYEAFFSVDDAFARTFPRSVDGRLPVSPGNTVRNASKSTTPPPRPAKVVSWKDGKEITVPWTRPAPLPPWEVQTDELMAAIRVGIDACSTLPAVRAELERSIAQASTRGEPPVGMLWSLVRARLALGEDVPREERIAVRDGYYARTHEDVEPHRAAFDAMLGLT